MMSLQGISLLFKHVINLHFLKVMVVSTIIMLCDSKVFLNTWITTISQHRYAAFYYFRRDS